MPLAPGSRLGPYEIVAPPGGMGEVYRGRDTRLDRTVAIKVLPFHLSDKPDARSEAFGRIEFLEWTESDRLRHSKFVGLREDKDARKVVKEV